MALVFTSTNRDRDMKECGVMIYSMELDKRYGLMANYILAVISKDCSMDLEYGHGQMAVHIMVIGKEAKCQAMAPISGPTV